MSEIELLCYLMGEAFDGKGIEQSNESQSLMSNLATVEATMWTTRPDRTVRTIESIVHHVGSTKLMYAEYAFGQAQLAWESPDVRPWPEGAAPMQAAVEWLREAHARLMRDVEALTDGDLGVERLANWGERRQTRWLLSMLLQHDLYHAGEINHIRAQLAGEDRWRWQIYFG